METAKTKVSLREKSLSISQSTTKSDRSWDATGFSEGLLERPEGVMPALPGLGIEYTDNDIKCLASLSDEDRWVPILHVVRHHISSGDVFSDCT